MLVAELACSFSRERRAVRAGDAVKGAACRRRLQRRRAAGSCHQRHVRRRLAGRSVSNQGIGTLIYANEYEHIRPAKKKDVAAIQLLTKQAVEADELVKRTRRSIEKSLGDYSSSRLIRIRSPASRCMCIPSRTRASWPCLYVSAAHENQGIGRKLIQFVENKARELGLDELLALSTQAFTYFQVEGRLRGRHAGRFAPAATGKIRAERP